MDRPRCRGSVCRAFEAGEMIDGLFGAGAELDELGLGLPVQGAVGHSHAEVAAEGGLVAFEEGPVEGGEGAGVVGEGFFGVVLAVAAEVGHAVDVGGAGDVGLGGGEAAVGVGGHAEDVGLDDPVVGVDVAEPEPVGELAGGEAAEVGEVGEDHEAGDVVGPAVVEDLLDAGVEALKAGLDAPVGGGKRGGWRRGRRGWRRRRDRVLVGVSRRASWRVRAGAAL